MVKAATPYQESDRASRKLTKRKKSKRPSIIEPEDVDENYQIKDVKAEAMADVAGQTEQYQTIQPNSQPVVEEEDNVVEDFDWQDYNAGRQERVVAGSRVDSSEPYQSASQTQSRIVTY